MLGLKLSTDPRWVNIVEGNLDEILSDHAWCEQKAATNCISIIISNPEKTEMIETLTEIAREELSHFGMVVEKIKQRGKVLGVEKKDDYVNELYKFMKKGATRNIAMVDRLLFAAMIEARSCERFRVLSENLKDEKLKKFYRDLMISEANHYTVFIGLAKKYSTEVDVETRWQQWLDYEAQIISNYGKKETIHG